MERTSFAGLFQRELRIRLEQEYRLIFVDQWNTDAGEIGIYVRKGGERTGIYRSLSDELRCHQNGAGIEGVVTGYLSKLEIAQKEASGKRWRSFSEAEKYLFAGLINQKWEPGHMVCYRFGDFIGICVLIHHEDKMAEIYLPNKDDLKNWDITAESLWKAAKENTQIQKPPIFTPLDQIVEHIIEQELQQDRAKEVVEETLRAIREQPSEVPMYLLTNRDSIFGAVCMLDEDIMNRISETFQSDLILIPSSIHEILIIPCKEGDEVLQACFLKELLHGINEEMPCMEELLSDFLYCYERAARKLRIL